MYLILPSYIETFEQVYVAKKRDVTLGENKSRIRTDTRIFAKSRSSALNIMRKNKVENVSLELFESCMTLDKVINYDGILQN